MLNKYGGFAHSRRATMNVTSATWNSDLLATQNGTTVYDGSSQVTYYDIISANAAGKYYTKFTAVGSTNNEITYLYVLNDDGTYAKIYTQGTTVKRDTFVYSTETREITFSTEDAPLPGEKLACAYTFNTAKNAQRISIRADGIPPTVLVTANGIVKDVCNGALFMIAIEGQAQVDGNWTFDVSADGEPAVQNLSMEFVKGCIGSELYNYTIYTEDEDLYVPDHITLSVPTGDLLGKDASELQNGLAISEAGKVTGTLKYVSNYTGFSSDTFEQNGYYFPFKVDVPADKGEAKATMQVNNKKPVDLDLNDGIGIIFMGKDEATAVGKQIILDIDWDGEAIRYPHETIILDMREVKYAPKA